MNTMLFNYSVTIPSISHKPMYLELNSLHRKRIAFMMDYGGMELAPYCASGDSDIEILSTNPHFSKVETIMTIGYITTLEGSQ